MLNSPRTDPQAKRQTELVKHVALNAQALLRLCAAAGLAAPDVTALRSVAMSAKATGKLLPPKTAGHLERLLATLSEDRKSGEHKKRARDGPHAERPAKRPSTK